MNKDQQGGKNNDSAGNDKSRRDYFQRGTGSGGKR